MNTVKVLGITDEQSTCDCCGKNNLKRVIVLDIDGTIVKYGTTCAAKAQIFGKGVKKAQIDLIAKAISIYEATKAKHGIKVAIDNVWNRIGFSIEVKKDGRVIMGATSEGIELTA